MVFLISLKLNLYPRVPLRDGSVSASSDEGREVLLVGLVKVIPKDVEIVKIVLATVQARHVVLMEAENVEDIKHLNKIYFLMIR